VASVGAAIERSTTSSGRSRRTGTGRWPCRITGWQSTGHQRRCPVDPRINHTWMSYITTTLDKPFWRASHIPDSGPNKVRHGMEDGKRQSEAGGSLRSFGMKRPRWSSAGTRSIAQVARELGINPALRHESGSGGEIFGRHAGAEISW